MEYGTKKCFGKLKWAVMHKPGPELELVRNPPDWGFHGKPNIKNTMNEFDELYDNIKAEGVKIEMIDVEDAPPPNLYYTRDLGICTDDGFILANFRAEYRQGEELYLQIMSDKLDIPIFYRIMNEYFEAGDYVQINDDIAALGLTRSSYGGFEEVADAVDLTVLPVPHDRHFAHLDILFNMIREDLAIVCVNALPNEFLEFLKKNGIESVDTTLMEQEYLSSDVLMLEPNKVIINEEAEHAIRSLEKRGVDVIETPLHELKKGGGGPGCLVLTLLRK